MSDQISLVINGAVGVVTLNNPPHNLMGEGFIDDYCKAQELAVEKGVRAILVRSQLRHFCAGADTSGLDGGGPNAAEVLDKLESIPVPTVAAVPPAADPLGLLKWLFKRTKTPIPAALKSSLAASSSTVSRYFFSTSSVTWNSAAPPRR